MSEYSKMAKGSFTSPGTSAVINLPFQPDFVELWNYTNIKTAGTHKVTRAWWDSTLLDGSNNPTMLELYAGSSTAVVFDTINNSSSNPGVNTFAAGQLLQFGPAYKHTGSTDFSITAASPAVVSTTTNHGLVSGDVVIFEGLYQTSTTGMAQMDGVPLTVTVTGATTFSVPWVASGANYTAFNSATSTGNVGQWKKVLYPYLYFPGTTVITNITLGATTTIDTASAHNFVVGQEVAFRIPSAWGTVELNSLPNTLVPGSPVYGYVVSVTDYNTVVVNINSNAFTAFNPNQTIASVPGLSYPQIVAVGDINTGGVQISSGSALYPPPYTLPIGTTRVNTINGPAIQGAFVNNTSQGFTIGSGTAAVDTTSTFMTTSDIIGYRAFKHDIANP